MSLSLFFLVKTNLGQEKTNKQTNTQTKNKQTKNKTKQKKKTNKQTNTFCDFSKIKKNYQKSDDLDPL